MRWITLYLGYLISVVPALAQGYHTDNPNLHNFYMGRQEWQYVDTSPVVTGQPSQAPAAQPSAPALPKAGFMPYSQSIPSVHEALPNVNNGVPKPTPPQATHELKSKAASLKAKPAASTASKGLKTYKPYNNYGNTTPSTVNQTSTSVKGSLLHWARPHARSY